MKQTAHFGVGKMGRRWLEPLSENTDIGAIIDPDPRSSRVAERHGAEFFNSIATASDEGLGSQLSSSVAPTADLWSITTPVYSHADLSAAGLFHDIPYLITEKPLSIDPSSAEKLAAKEESQDSVGIVNYIERMNPVVRTIVKKVGQSFSPTRLYHWRSKTSRNIHPYARNNLGHDLSEIHRLYQAVGRPFELEPTTVSMETWEETDRSPDHSLRDIYDAGAHAELTDNADAEITLRGSFYSNDERRYFMWVDDHDMKAFFGSTVERDHLTPIAARVGGKDQIDELYEAVENGALVNDKSIEAKLADVDADILFQDAVSSTDVLYDTVEVLLNNDEEGALAYYRDAATYERILHDIYTVGGSSMYEEEARWLEEQTGSVQM